MPCPVLTSAYMVLPDADFDRQFAHARHPLLHFHTSFAVLRLYLVQRQGICLRARYAMSGTDFPYGCLVLPAIVLCFCSTTRLVLTWAMSYQVAVSTTVDSGTVKDPKRLLALFHVPLPPSPRPPAHSLSCFRRPILSR
eukprot:1350223-Rhodomonas_salina.1